MAAAIAHEIKNPLAGIQVMAGLLKRQLPDSSDEREILTDIITEAKMANRIVVDVLEFVRPIRLQVEPVSLRGVLNEAVATARSHPGAGRTDIVIDCATDLPDLDADQLQLRQVFTNLLINATEALDGAGHIWITASYAAVDESPEPIEPPEYVGYVSVEVTDDGPDVPVEDTDRLFSPFFTTKPIGSGLGLAIVRKIINGHDGRIEVGPRAGGGATFGVRLPVSYRVVEAARMAKSDRTARGSHV